jgi:hypothetical protein
MFESPESEGGVQQLILPGPISGHHLCTAIIAFAVALPHSVDVSEPPSTLLRLALAAHAISNQINQ